MIEGAKPGRTRVSGKGCKVVQGVGRLVSISLKQDSDGRGIGENRTVQREAWQSRGKY